MDFCWSSAGLQQGSSKVQEAVQEGTPTLIWRWSRMISGWVSHTKSGCPMLHFALALESNDSRTSGCSLQKCECQPLFFWKTLHQRLKAGRADASPGTFGMLYRACPGRIQARTV